jgi:signal transduction histidine kinase
MHQSSDNREAYYLDLLNVVSHEIKNTATSIHGYNRLLKRSLNRNDVESSLDSTDQIERLSVILYGLCDSLYYLSLIDQDTLIHSNRPFDLSKNALEPVLEEMEQEFKRNNLKLKVDSPVQGVLFLGEDRLFRIAFRNILKNAVLFSDKGKSVTITLKRHSDSINILIRNHGPAFAPEELDTLFERYVTVNPRVRKNPGYNLYIVKRIIEVHGGTIQVDRTRGGWMRFSIILPVPD